MQPAKLVEEVLSDSLSAAFGPQLRQPQTELSQDARLLGLESGSSGAVLRVESQAPRTTPSAHDVPHALDSWVLGLDRVL